VKALGVFGQLEEITIAEIYGKLANVEKTRLRKAV
jgi:hypothetical protein